VDSMTLSPTSRAGIGDDPGARPLFVELNQAHQHLVLLAEHGVPTFKPG